MGSPSRRKCQIPFSSTYCTCNAVSNPYPHATAKPPRAWAHSGLQCLRMAWLTAHRGRHTAHRRDVADVMSCWPTAYISPPHTRACARQKGTCRMFASRMFCCRLANVPNLLPRRCPVLRRWCRLRARNQSAPEPWDIGSRRPKNAQCGSGLWGTRPPTATWRAHCTCAPSQDVFSVCVHGVGLRGISCHLR